MTTAKKINCIIITLVFNLLLSPQYSFSDEQVIATIDVKNITIDDFKYEVKRHGISKSFQNRLLTLTPEGKKKILNELIRENLFYIAAKQEGTTLDKDAERELEKLKSEIIIKKYLKTELDANPVTEKEMKKYYEENLSQFTIPESRKLRHIVVKTQDDAQKILNELKKDKDFAQLAREHNIDATKDQGGDLRWVEKGIMVKEFEDAAFSLLKGEMSNVVSTQFGYHIIKVEDIKKSEIKKYESIQNEVKQKVEEERISKLEDALRVKYELKINSDIFQEVINSK